jgi:hypothetical protein
LVGNKLDDKGVSRDLGNLCNVPKLKPMTTNKNSLTQIEEALARNNANICANLIGVAQIFAQLDERFAALEGKLERLLAERPPPAAGGAATNFSDSTVTNRNAAREQLIALLDQRIGVALEREQRALSEATSHVVRDVLRDFVDEFKQVRTEIELKLKHLEKLLAERPPLDPLRSGPTKLEWAFCPNWGKGINHTWTKAKVQTRLALAAPTM